MNRTTNESCEPGLLSRNKIQTNEQAYEQANKETTSEFSETVQFCKFSETADLKVESRQTRVGRYKKLQQMYTQRLLNERENLRRSTSTIKKYNKLRIKQSEQLRYYLSLKEPKLGNCQLWFKHQQGLQIQQMVQVACYMGHDQLQRNSESMVTKNHGNPGGVGRYVGLIDSHITSSSEGR